MSSATIAWYGALSRPTRAAGAISSNRASSLCREASDSIGERAFTKVVEHEEVAGAERLSSDRRAAEVVQVIEVAKERTA